MERQQQRRGLCEAGNGRRHRLTRDRATPRDRQEHARGGIEQAIIGVGRNVFMLYQGVTPECQRITSTRSRMSTYHINPLPDVDVSHQPAPGCRRITSTRSRMSTYHINSLPDVDVSHQPAPGCRRITSTRSRMSTYHINPLPDVDVSHQPAPGCRRITSTRSRMSTYHINSLPDVDVSHQPAPGCRRITSTRSRMSTYHINPLYWAPDASRVCRTTSNIAYQQNMHVHFENISLIR